MEMLERTHAANLAQTVREAAEAAANQAAQAAHKAGDRAGGLIDPLVEPLRGGRHKPGAWGRMMNAAGRHPWALAASVAVLVGIVYAALRDSAGGLDIDELAADADASRFRSAA